MSARLQSCNAPAKISEAEALPWLVGDNQRPVVLDGRIMVFTTRGGSLVSELLTCTTGPSSMTDPLGIDCPSVFHRRCAANPMTPLTFSSFSFSRSRATSTVALFSSVTRSEPIKWNGA